MPGYQSIDLYVPTRGRPRNIRRLLNSIRNTAQRPERLTVYFYVDNDDPATILAARELKSESVRFLCAPQKPLVGMYNTLRECSSSDILWSGGDDIVFRTPGWDVIIDEEFAAVPDGILLVYGDDCLGHEKLATHPFVSRRATDILGYFYPECDGISLTDIWLHPVYMLLGRLHYRPDLVTDHLHWLRHLAEYDDTYAAQHEQNFPQVRAAMLRHSAKLYEDIRKLADAMEPVDGDAPRNTG